MQVLDDFKRGRCLMLSATDVAARGLDVKDVSKVDQNRSCLSWKVMRGSVCYGFGFRRIGCLVGLATTVDDKKCSGKLLLHSRF